VFPWLRQWIQHQQTQLRSDVLPVDLQVAGGLPAPASSLQATRATPSHGTSVAMPSAGRAAAALPSTAPSALPERARSHSAERPEAGGEETLDVLKRRATTEHDAKFTVSRQEATGLLLCFGTRECGAPAPSLCRRRCLGNRGWRAGFPSCCKCDGYAGGHARPAAGAPTGAEPTAASVRHLAAVVRRPSPRKQPAAGTPTLWQQEEHPRFRLMPHRRAKLLRLRFLPPRLTAHA